MNRAREHKAMPVKFKAYNEERVTILIMIVYQNCFGKFENLQTLLCNNFNLIEFNSKKV